MGRGGTRKACCLPVSASPLTRVRIRRTCPRARPRYGRHRHTTFIQIAEHRPHLTRLFFQDESGHLSTPPGTGQDERVKCAWPLLARPDRWLPCPSCFIPSSFILETRGPNSSTSHAPNIPSSTRPPMSMPKTKQQQQPTCLLPLRSCPFYTREAYSHPLHTYIHNIYIAIHSTHIDAR